MGRRPQKQTESVPLKRFNDSVLGAVMLAKTSILVSFCGGQKQVRAPTFRGSGHVDLTLRSIALGGGPNSRQNTPATIPILSLESWMLRLGSGTSSGAMVLDTVDRLASDSVWDRTRRLLIPAPGVGRPGPVKKKISQSSTSSDSPIVKVDTKEEDVGCLKTGCSFTIELRQ